MQALTSYQHAHDAAGERAADRDEQIDRIAFDIIWSKDEFVEQIEQMLSRDKIQPAEMIALLFATRMPEKVRPPWAQSSSLEYAIRNLQLNISAYITREATARVDAREE
jgi:hypothetical protein